MSSIAVAIYGPIFIGVVLNILLYGIMITQTYIYFNTFKQDRTWMKAFVGLLFLCDTVNCVFDIIFLYVPLINDFGDELALTTASWVFATDPAMTAIIGSLVQLFFAWRVKVLTNSTPAVLVITACAIVSLLGGIGTSIAVGMIPQFFEFQKFKVIVIIWLIASSVADCLITFVLVGYLRVHKTGFGPTDDFVNKIIRMTVQTGLITALWATVDLIVYLASPTGLHLIFNIPLAKLYTNSLMSSLNSRAGWSYGSNSSGPATAESGNRGRNFGVRTGGEASQMTPSQVYVDVESHEMVDVVDAKGVYPPEPALNTHGYSKRSVVLTHTAGGAPPPRS
ncbi:uncharacterized protein BXZ73DRAFT_101170 [Epithele typhae]|uniref:uncharacterized protein n=1 Tax=Epithele typhae TaxID=378194 RepID=UPI002007F2A5|nr:uncharacterized protein BXZ73DRAFT_101170 [Epithele typhae]KAH9933208.1 hypothetical protein BXZ73DRAFT_101170 [Epithele typhae]